MTSSTTFNLTASYASPTNPPFTHTTSLPSPSPTSTISRTTYLHSLKSAVSALQEKINIDLTARMEDDKVREAAKDGKEGGKKGKNTVVDEKMEEDNYGEEVVEED